MIITNKIKLSNFAKKHAASMSAIDKWVEKVQKANWKSHNELKLDFPSADFVGRERCVFNIKGNNYRLVVMVVFVAGILDVRFIGTHGEYDKIKDCSKI